MRPDFTAPEPLGDLGGEVDLDPDPPASPGLADAERRPAAAEGVEDEVSLHGRHLDDAVEQLGGQGVGLAVLRLELPMADGRNVRPDVLQGDSPGIQGAPMASVVLDLASAVPASLDRGPDP